MHLIQLRSKQTTEQEIKEMSVNGNKCSRELREFQVFSKVGCVSGWFSMLENVNYFFPLGFARAVSFNPLT